MNIINLIQNHTFTSTDKQGIKRELVYLFNKHQYLTFLNFWIPNRGDGRTGYIDIVLDSRHGDFLSNGIAIHIDYKKPKKKTIHKLNNTLYCKKIIIIRNPKPWTQPNPKGIDYVININEQLRKQGIKV